jgi:hypothetical protein
MVYDTAYYWRIDEINKWGTTTGDIWSFTTRMSPPQPPPPPLSASYISVTGQYILAGPDYHLLPGSPCINAGDPNYVAAPNETDLDGNPRVIGCRIDMGAFEYGNFVPAELRIIPRNINLANKDKSFTAYLPPISGSPKITMSLILNYAICFSKTKSRPSLFRLIMKNELLWPVSPTNSLRKSSTSTPAISS